jgi:predicted double-glycine peptidase
MTRRATLLLAIAALASAGAAHAEVRLVNPAGGGGEYALRVTSWRDMPFRTVVRQQYDYSCGSAALATLLKHHYGVEVGEADLFTAMWEAGDQDKIRKAGFSLLDMKRYLEARGWKADGYRLPLDQLAEAGRPWIALIDLGSYRHFVVIKGVRSDRVLVGDPALGMKAYTRAEFQKIWNGVAFVPRPAGGEPGAFNRVADWNYRNPAPLGMALDDRSLEAFSREISPPIYQVLPVVEVALPGGPT